jgi:hypothetical protein
MTRPRLGVFLNGVPDVENLWHLIAHLHAAGRIEVVAFVTSALMRREPRVRALFQAAGLTPLVRPNRLMKWRFWYARALRGIDRVLVIGDPATDQTAFAVRGHWIAAQGLPSTFVQHGVIQDGITYVQTPRRLNFHSDQIFLWQPAADCAVDFAPGVTDRVTVSGFVKQPVFAPRPPDVATQAWLAGFRNRLLICHTFRTERQAGQAQAFYAMIDGFLTAHRETGVIIRPHRGKERSHYAAAERDLQKRHPNLRFSYAHTGAFRGTTITDVLALVDCLVSTPSTALLDGLYNDLPTAQLARDFAMFDALPQVTDGASLAAFVAGGWTPGMADMRARYGAVAANLARVADQIAARMMVDPARTDGQAMPGLAHPHLKNGDPA